MRKGYVKTLDEAYEKYLSPQSDTYVPRQKMSVEEAVKVIEAAGGCSVLAHPAEIKNQSLIKGIIALGVKESRCITRLTMQRQMRNIWTWRNGTGCLLPEGVIFTLTTIHGLGWLGIMELNANKCGEWKKFIKNKAQKRPSAGLFL